MKHDRDAQPDSVRESQGHHSGEPDDRMVELALSHLDHLHEFDPERAASKGELEWKAAIDGMRDGLAGAVSSPEQPQGLAQRILAQTTREDLTWRGELRLVSSYVWRGIGSSGLLRLAAASLLIHLAALPVLAYFVWFAPPKPINLGFERWEQAHPANPFPEPRMEDSDLTLPIEDSEQPPLIRELAPDPPGTELPKVAPTESQGSF